MNIALIVQARMGSTRLPGKVLMDLSGKTVLQRTVQACQRANVGMTMVATGDTPDNIAIEKHCSELGVPCYRGSESDVLQRYAQIIEGSHYDTVVRVTADCPLVDRRQIRALVDDFKEAQGYNYLGCTNSPDGNDVEVFSREALLRANRLATDPADREHVTRFMRRLPGRMPYPEPTYTVKYSIDTQSDFNRCVHLLHACGEDAKSHVYVAAALALRKVYA